MEIQEVIQVDEGFLASMIYVGQKKFTTSSNITKIGDGLNVGDEIIVLIKSINKYSKKTMEEMK